VDNLFININKNKVSEYHDSCHNHESWLTDGMIEQNTTDVWWWIEKNHQCNCKLWDEEDKARRIDVDDSELAMNKRNIDMLNQKRNDAIERIDEIILFMIRNVNIVNGAWFNSETVGSIIDRLSIASLKILHMGVQAGREDISIDERQDAKRKQENLIVQRDDLLFCFNRLLDSIAQGDAYYKIYRQFKMYNDPLMNPYLSKLISSN